MMLVTSTPACWSSRRRALGLVVSGRTLAWGLGIVLLVFHNKDVCELDGEDSIIGAGLGLNLVYDGSSKSNLRFSQKQCFDIDLQHF